MGYSTDFSGSISIEPPLNDSEVEYLESFAETRHMVRKEGQYFIGDTEDDVYDHDRPPLEQPSLWCDFAPSDDGTYLEWTGAEKTQAGKEWIEYIINHFLKPDALAKKTNIACFRDFTFNHICNGVINAFGEDHDDVWRIVVKDNKVTREEGRIVYGSSNKEPMYSHEEGIATVNQALNLIKTINQE